MFGRRSCCLRRRCWLLSLLSPRVVQYAVVLGVEGGEAREMGRGERGVQRQLLEILCGGKVGAPSDPHCQIHTV